MRLSLTVYVVAVAVLLVSSLLLSWLIGLTAFVDAKKYKYRGSGLLAGYMMVSHVRPDLAQVSLFETVGNAIAACSDTNTTNSDAESNIREISTEVYRTFCNDFMTFSINYCNSTDPNTSPINKDERTVEGSICLDPLLTRSMSHYATVNHISVK